MVGLKRLSLRDVTESDLTYMVKAVRYCPDATMDDWITWVNDGRLALFRIEKEGEALGLTGLMAKQGGRVHVEFVVGRGLVAHAKEFLEAIRREARGLPLECLVHSRALERLYERVGWKRVGTWMRID